METICKNLLAPALIILQCSLALAGKPVEGFQNAKFGISYSQVKEQYPSLSSLETKNGISAATLSNATIVGRNAGVVFKFRNDNLYEVVVVVTTESTADQAEMAEFARIKELLTNAYGSPKDSSTSHHTPFGRDMTALKIRSGDLAWIANWHDKETGNQISLQLTGTNYKSSVKIFYTDAKLEKEANRAIAESQSNEL